MEILLTHGYFLAEDPAEQSIMRPYPPLGVLYLSSFLKKQGHAVEVVDNTFSTLESFRRTLARRQPRVLGISVNMMTKFAALEIIRMAKKQGCVVIVGGPDPPHYAEAYLRWGADFVVLGEGEQTLDELLQVLPARHPAELEKVAGLAYLDERGTLRQTPPRPLMKHLDDFPLPDRAAIDISAYLTTWRRAHGTASLSLLTARGCPYRCTWCSHTVFGHTLRKRSPQRVAGEVQQLCQTYRPDMLWYADDVFNIDHKWLFAYAAELKMRNIHIPFECICRADRLNERILLALREMGCVRMWIGSESGSQRLLDAMKRGVKAEQVQQMCRLARKQGIETGMFLMWGFGDENAQDIAETIAHVKKAAPDLVLTTVSYPIKGTPYYQELSANRRLVDSRPWQSCNDRDYQVRGRPSRRYYDFANRWLFNEIELMRLQRQNGRAARWRRAWARWRIKTCRLGLRLLSGTREA